MPSSTTTREIVSRLGTRALPPRSPNDTKPSSVGQISRVRPMLRAEATARGTRCAGTAPVSSCSRRTRPPASRRRPGAGIRVHQRGERGERGFATRVRRSPTARCSAPARGRGRRCSTCCRSRPSPRGPTPATTARGPVESERGDAHPHRVGRAVGVERRARRARPGVSSTMSAATSSASRAGSSGPSTTTAVLAGTPGVEPVADPAQRRRRRAARPARPRRRGRRGSGRRARRTRRQRSTTRTPSSSCVAKRSLPLRGRPGTFPDVACQPTVGGPEP